MINDYKMLRNSGLSVFGSIVFCVGLILVGPVVYISDRIGRNQVGETGVEFDDDFDGNAEFIEDVPFEKFSDLNRK